MRIEDLTILSVVENDKGLFDLMVKSVLANSRGSKPKFLICENGKSEGCLDKYRTDDNFNIIQNEPKLRGGSNRHGDGINALLGHIQTKYCVIVESDCVIVSDMWNDLFLKRAALSKKGDSVYYAAFMAFETDTAKGIDFRPGTDSTRTSNKSYKPDEDVGWRISSVVNHENITLIDCVDCKAGSCNVLDNSYQSEEFMLRGKTIAVHFGRGSNLGGKATRKGFADHNTQMNNFKSTITKFLNLEVSE